ncbi:hypothetical protein [Capnocytophaga canimorsus]|uniref:hypothetical protein n=1 Tax=Capnocytophaga canimorsus TaxID=28188 RepID=UPI001AC55A75|nr:hypothetical protein [Capnocytophaga canimorsus]GIM59636.1 hypothetical protein CAPN007_18450 [Capnocytophaga canimorsus]
MTKVDLYIPCPACMSNGINTVREYWTHYGVCSGRLCIDEYAYVHCRKCAKKALITQMKFSCPAGRHHFEVATTEGLCEAFSASAQMVNANANNWFINVMKNIR